MEKRARGATNAMAPEGRDSSADRRNSLFPKQKDLRAERTEKRLMFSERGGRPVLAKTALYAVDSEEAATRVKSWRSDSAVAHKKFTTSR